jgi:AraC-like DNA-binding protein
MNVKNEVVYPTPGYSFCFQTSRDRKLHYNWHNHQEYEFVVCRNGAGEAHIAERMCPYKSPAAYFIAPKTGHAVVSAGSFDGWIIQIPPFVLDHYEARPEFHFLADLIRRASPALCFSQEASRAIIGYLERAQDQTGIFRWFRLLEAFHAASGDKNALSMNTADDALPQTDRLNAVINHLFNESARPQNLNDTARNAGMSVASFCRHFKKRTGMTFIEYLHSIRINTAKKLLQQSKMYVDDICFESGFMSVAFFNRKFKEQTTMTPLEYRRRFRTENPEEK